MPGGTISRILGYWRRRRPPTPSEWFGEYRNWTPVSSSNVSSIAFYESPTSVGGNILGVRFKNSKGGVTEYRYPGITRGQYNSLMGAASKGRWIHQNLKKTRTPYQGPI